MNPILVVMAVSFCFAVIGVPWAYAFERGQDGSLFFEWTRYCNDAVIWKAYWWTLYAFGAMFLFMWMFGAVRRLREYQCRSVEITPLPKARVLWRWATVINVALLSILFVQAGFTIPLLDIFHSSADFYIRSQIRTEVREALNQTVFNINLYVVAMFAMILAWYNLRRWRYRIISSTLLFLSASFTLDKSQLGAALFILLAYAALERRVKFLHVFYAGLGLIGVIVPFYFVAAITSNLSDTFRMLWGRIAYGAWMGFPYYFELYSKNRQPVTSILPPYIISFFHLDVISPARRAMIFLEPVAALSGAAGAFPCIFPGEALAVGGTPLMILSPMIAAAEFSIIVFCFSLLKKRPVTIFFFSWFIYKFQVALITGSSFFFISSFTFGIALLVGYTILQVTMRVPVHRKYVHA